MKIFLDANVILDFLDSQRPGHSVARSVIGTLYKEGRTIVITEDLLTTIYYVVRNKNAVLDFFSVIQKEWLIVPFGKDRIFRAISICRNNPKADLEDVLQSLSALDLECRYVISNDMNFYDCGVDIATARDFVDLVL